jgi:hypothetical protein
MAAEAPHAGKGKAAGMQARRTAHAAHPAPKRAAQAKSTAPRPTRVATSVKKRA